MDANAPGCFSSIISFSDTSPTCQTCSYKSECGERSYKALMEMRDAMDVSEFEKRFAIDRIKAGKSVDTKVVKVTGQRLKMTEEQKALCEDESLPKKVRMLLARIFRKGYDAEYLSKAVDRGINPFAEQTPAILEKAFDLVIKGSFAKIELSRLYMSMGMNKRTAYSQTTIVIGALSILEIVESDALQIVRRRRGQ